MDAVLSQSKAAPVAVFDSGVGGLSVLKALLLELPHERFVFLADEAYLPYGDKPQAVIAHRVLTVAQALQQQGNKALVMACNTATAAAANQARQHWPAWPIVGIEPAVKPATLMTKTGVVGILATSNTVASVRFQALVERFDPLARVVAKPCPGLVELIEQVPINEAAVREHLRPVMNAFQQDGVDVIVLGCTHYPFVAPIIQQMVGEQVTLIETGRPVARQLRHRLDESGSLHEPDLTAMPEVQRVRFYTTGSVDGFKQKLVSLMGSDWCSAVVEPQHI
ncbi:glutamate racemase [Limnobacter humi]|uniref:Glutamate racemase n=1 Tax=Limnobacter humi TaxID=1778671 RepID=A0ABT1WK82_9BURK|nr:glutamate racemase [Limnobacter humi]MCQ8896904.1 glutamate racemase [Limnobacter humi]